MPKRSSNPRDINRLAASIVQQATGEPVKEKNQAAVELGKLGGRKGGLIRAANLSAKKRKAIASKAAKARWAARDKAAKQAKKRPPA